MYKFKIEVGDRYGDGHGKYEEIVVESNHSMKECLEAYTKSCLLTGVRFDHTSKISEDSLTYSQKEKRSIATNYEESYIHKEAYELLKAAGFKFTYAFSDVELEELEEEGEEYYYSIDGCEDLVDLLEEFIKLSLPTLKWRQVDDGLESFPLHIGYGMFD